MDNSVSKHVIFDELDVSVGKIADIFIVLIATDAEHIIQFIPDATTLYMDKLRYVAKNCQTACLKKSNRLRQRIHGKIKANMIRPISANVFTAKYKASYIQLTAILK